MNIEQGTPLVDCAFETKPLTVKADYAVTLKVEPIEATYDSVSAVEDFLVYIAQAFLRVNQVQRSRPDIKDSLTSESVSLR